MARIFFMGTPEFAQHSLKSLVASPHEVVAVASQPPRRSGRGMKERLSPVHEYACQHDIPVMTPLRLRDPVVQQEMALFDADLAIVAAYGLLLPSAVLGMFPLGCMNLHASLLPRWRGAEIGGQLEAEAGKWIKENGTKPVVAFIAGETAPAGRTMGHAGAIVGGAEDTAAAKKAILRDCGITVVDSPADLGTAMAKLLGK